MPTGRVPCTLQLSILPILKKTISNYTVSPSNRKIYFYLITYHLVIMLSSLLKFREAYFITITFLLWYRHKCSCFMFIDPFDSWRVSGYLDVTKNHAMTTVTKLHLLFSIVFELITVFVFSKIHVNALVIGI